MVPYEERSVARGSSERTSHPLVRLARHCSAVHPYQGGDSALEVASGEADVTLDAGGGPWDYAPFVIPVEEAGGVARDIRGQARFDGGSLLVTTVAHSS